MIVLNSVTKFYRYKKIKHQVFNNLSLNIPLGKNIGIIGPNGAGKSTLLRLIGRMERPNSGTVKHYCKVSWPVSLNNAFQTTFTARENVSMVCMLYGKSHNEKLKIINYVEEFAGIGHHFDMPINTYSSGMKSRVGFGTSMAFDFDVYLVDEVTSVGDSVFKKRADEIFAEKKKNSTIVMVSHSMPYLKNLCDMGIYIPKNGKISIHEDIGEAIEKYQREYK